MCIVYILYNFFMHDMCTSLSVLIIIMSQYRYNTNTETSAVKQSETTTYKFNQFDLIKNQKLKNWIHTLKIIPVLQ